jgi:RNA polymerase sigma-70 factor (ECF subfamily)
MDARDTDELLERLARGEVAVAEELHAAYEAYLRAVVRRQLSDRLRAGFDSADVVQSVWVHVVRHLTSAGWRVAGRAQLRALLATIARRRLVSRARGHARAVPAENCGGEVLDAVPASHQPRPSEEAQAGELWEQMLALCPPEHRPVLRLKREGLPPAEIATRTGLHEGSVRRILRRLSRELALHVRPLAGSADRPPEPEGEE